MDSLKSFEDGPYGVLKYEVTRRNGKLFLEVNGGDLGRLPIESADTVEKLRECLNIVEEELKEKERRNEEL